MSANPPADWYQDPAEPGARRFWDGEAWTTLVVAGDRSEATSELAGDPSGPTAPPAGWYGDPADAGQRRYWNGVTWTTRVLTRTTASASPIVVASGRPERDQTVPAPGAEDLAETATASAAAAEDLAETATVPEEGGVEVGGSVSSGDAIADLMATVDAAGEPSPGRRRTRRSVVLALTLLIALVVTAGLVGRSRQDPTPSEDARPAETTLAPPAEPAESETTAPAPAAADLVVVDVGPVYDACQDLVRASPLSNGVRLVFQPDEDVVAATSTGRTQIEFWVRERGNRDEDQHVGFVCVVDANAPADPRLYMEI